MKTILVVVAHPDDEVLGMGGTIAKLHKSGHKISLLIVTDGSTTQYSGRNDILDILEEKKNETMASASILGIDEVLFGDLPDMKLDTVEHTAINKVIEDAVSRVDPDVIFTHFYGDVNVDHQLVYKSVLVAARPIPGRKLKELYCFSVPSSTEWSPQLTNTVFMPNCFVDISETADLKYKAMLEYSAELREYPHPRSIKYLEQTDVASGLQVGLMKAESFMLLRKIV